MATMSILFNKLTDKQTVKALGANGVVMAPVKVVTGSTETYVTGGISFDPAAVGISDFQFAVFTGTNGYVAEVDQTNKKIKLLQGNYTNTADGPLTELANGTSIANLTLYGFILGT